jgi:hypothetical protein
VAKQFPSVLGVLAVLAALSACSSGTDAKSAGGAQASSPNLVTSQPAASTAEPSPSTAETSEGQLRAAAEMLDRAATNRDLETAWSFYSQRCKYDIGSVEVFGHILDSFYAGRTPKYTDWTVRVNGSSGQVVTVDSDPNAPASVMNPRTWTFIDGRWQFDNC